MVTKRHLTNENRVVVVYSADHYRWNIHFLPGRGWYVALVRGGHGVKRVVPTPFHHCGEARAYCAEQVAAHNFRADAAFWGPDDV